MYIYSDYHDEFFEYRGFARDTVKDPALLRDVIEKYVPVEKILKVHMGAEVEVEGVYAAEVWIVLTDGITSLILADSPIPLTSKQWQIIINKLDELYRKVHGLLIEPKPHTSFENTLKYISDYLNSLGVKLKFLARMSKPFLKRSLNLIGLRPWETVLAISRDNIVEAYLVPRKVLKEVRKVLEDKATISYV